MGGVDLPVSLPTDGRRPDAPRVLPTADGFRFGTFTLGPANVPPPGDLDVAAAIAEFEERLPGMAEHLETDDPGMHTTVTVDFDFVVSGEVYLDSTTAPRCC